MANTVGMSGKSSRLWGFPAFLKAELLEKLLFAQERQQDERQSAAVTVFVYNCRWRQPDLLSIISQGLTQKNKTRPHLLRVLGLIGASA